VAPVQQKRRTTFTPPEPTAGPAQQQSPATQAPPAPHYTAPSVDPPPREHDGAQSPPEDVSPPRAAEQHHSCTASTKRLCSTTKYTLSMFPSSEHFPWRTSVIQWFTT
jgi:hypothetical protein